MAAAVLPACPVSTCVTPGISLQHTSRRGTVYIYVTHVSLRPYIWFWCAVTTHEYTEYRFWGIAHIQFPARLRVCFNLLLVLVYAQLTSIGNLMLVQCSYRSLPPCVSTNIAIGGTVSQRNRLNRVSISAVCAPS